VGISLAQTLLIRRADTHQNEIINYVARTQAVFEQAVNKLRMYLGHHIGPGNSRPGAQFELYQQLGQQSLHWAFVDVFRWTALLSFVCVVLVWFFRKVKHGRAPAAAH
jgi:DHA2 family multidrug resistance protein